MGSVRMSLFSCSGDSSRYPGWEDITRGVTLAFLSIAPMASTSRILGQKSPKSTKIKLSSVGVIVSLPYADKQISTRVTEKNYHFRGTVRYPRHNTHKHGDKRTPTALFGGLATNDGLVVQAVTAGGGGEGAARALPLLHSCLLMARTQLIGAVQHNLENSQL